MIVETNNYFGKLSEGECFFLVCSIDKRMMMKTEAVFDVDNDCNLNAVSLCDGGLHSYNDDVEVIPVPARVSF